MRRTAPAPTAQDTPPRCASGGGDRPAPDGYPAARDCPSLRALDRLARELAPDIWAAHQARPLPTRGVASHPRAAGGDR